MKNTISYCTMILMIIAFSILSTDALSQETQASNTDANTYVTGITPGRARSLVGVFFGLVSVIIGSFAKRRKRSWAITALALGIIAIILSAIHLANVTGGFGTGGGKAGAIVAIVLGLCGCALGGFALRLRKTV